LRRELTGGKQSQTAHDQSDRLNAIPMPIYRSADEPLAQIHRAGWLIRETRDAGIWLMIGTNGGPVIQIALVPLRNSLDVSRLLI
jgi:hypothetical protein